MPLVLAAPGLLDVDAQALAACNALSRVAARAQGERVDDGEAELLRAMDVEGAAAPFAALGAGLDVGTDWLARADPITTQVGHEDVRILARVDDLAALEVEVLRALLDRHFTADGLAFVAPRRDAWFVRSAIPQSVTLMPLGAVVDRPLRSLLPAGDDAKRWRRWWTEVQMLLHEHALAERAGAAVNALWFSAAGALPRERPPSWRTFATHGRDGDVLRGVATLAGAPSQPLAALREVLAGPQRDARLAVVADPVDATSPDSFAASLLAPALDALDRGRVDRVVLIASGRTGAARWTLARAGFVDRLLKRTASFVIPPRDDA